MSTNRQHLIAQLEAIPQLDGRFSRLKCINYDAHTGDKRGCFSLVFSAYDEVDGKRVAIKFFDIAPQNLQNEYRIKAFLREPEILSVLLGKKRCLQLVNAMKCYSLVINSPTGEPMVEIPCQYFVVEWIDEELDHFFLCQQLHSPEDKLRLFCDIVLRDPLISRVSRVSIFTS